uniref:Uncharacterized protein n=1 Tax=Acrobeloides nanus TaxID=290746 RepID=A0A914DGU9_9BILA
MIAGIISSMIIPAKAGIPETTAFRSACSWLCCTRSDADPSTSWSQGRSSSHSVYEVAQNDGSRSPNTVKNGRKISPIGAMPCSDHVVIRQKKYETGKKTSSQESDSIPAKVFVSRREEKNLGFSDSVTEMLRAIRPIIQVEAIGLFEKCTKVIR